MADRIDSIQDIRTWLDNVRPDLRASAGANGTLAVHRAAAAIWNDPGSPPAGEDWSAWLRGEEVADLIAEAAEKATAGKIEIGAVLDEWLPDEGPRDPLLAYVKVAATLDGKPITLGTLVGVPVFQQETCKKAGGDVGPFLRTWWADASDWQGIPSDRREEAEEALSKAAPRLWREARG